MRGPMERQYEGIYCNPHLMHTVGLSVGCITHVKVTNGSTFEGILRTFSNKADIVLEMAREIDTKKSTNNSGATTNSLALLTGHENLTDATLVFKFSDVVYATSLNVDIDYATRESFTDSGISKFNGQVSERELEPWDGGSNAVDGLELATENANGWNANDMFRTNEEKYGVKSSFDSNLPGYTIPLNKQNTEEYKQQEAKASKIAQEIESSLHHKSRSALENGDEEDRFSAVVRPENFNKSEENPGGWQTVDRNKNNNNFRNGRPFEKKNFNPPTQKSRSEENRDRRYIENNNNNNDRYPPNNRSRKTQNIRNIRNSPGPQVSRNLHQHSQGFHRVSSPAVAINNSQGNYKVNNSVSAAPCINQISPRPTPTSTPPAPRQPVQSNPVPSSTQFQQVPMTCVTSTISSIAQPVRVTPAITPTVPQEENHKINGEMDKTELKFAPKPPRSLNLQTAANKEIRDAVAAQQAANKNIEKRNEMEKKTIQKGRNDKAEDLKRFHAKFKLSGDPKEILEENSTKPDSQPSGNDSVPLPPKHPIKEKLKEEERKIDTVSENRSSPDNPKNSTLNPNAKEFIFNPNAKSFTPRDPAQRFVPPTVQPPPRLQTQSPIMAMPQPHIMPGMPQTVFNMTPHYVVSATPVSMPMAAPPFTPAASVAAAPRFRKTMPLPLQRHEMAQPVHVQAATGQPILAQPTLSASQFTIQYAPSPGMLHHPPGHPQQLAYAQMYSLMPRVLTPQPVGMVPTSAAYGENPQIPTHVYMHPGNPGSIQHAMAPTNGGQHSAPSTPQSQTPSLHPAPSPVHQPPPSAGHGQPQTPNGHHSNAPTPQPVMYTHGHMPTQHQIHANHHSSSNQGHPFAAATYAGAPQPIVLLPQQPAPHPAPFTMPNHLHGQNPGSHVGTPTHVLPHGPLMIPTSPGLVHTQTAISTAHYVPHSQV
ncbi:ataxin-2 [Caerostris darwini]|uniref:Ataxin-2 n=1 Tax=Caerostris darwini TaxID=1538125 RepID=A0AAV4TG57_9ARAC|nr:ataxin-2 [Caerostris darwini]